MHVVDWERLVPQWLHDTHVQGVLITDASLHIRFWNRWLVEASGKSAEAVIGQPLIALFPDLCERGLERFFTAALAGEEHLLLQIDYGYVLALPPPAGYSEFPQMQQRVRIGPVHDGGAIVGVVVLIDDLTDRARRDRAAEQILHEQQEARALFETLLTNAPVGFAFLDRALRFRHINDLMAQINRLPAEAHLGHTFAELFPQWANLIMPLYEEVLRTGEPLINHEVSAPPRDPADETRHYLVSHYPVRQADDTVIGLGSIVIETSEQKRAEAASRLLDQLGALLGETLQTTESLEQVARLTIPTLGECCLLEVHDGAEIRYIAASHAQEGACRALLPVLAAAATRPVLINNLAEADETSELDAEERATLAAQGLRAVLAVPLRTRGRRIGALACGSTHRYTMADRTLAGELGRRLALAIDAMQLYQAEQQARASAEEAVQIRDEFFSIAAHELRTPLTTMLGRIQLLERRMLRAANADERDLRAIKTISEQAIRLNRMISALLNVSQIEMGRLQIERVPLSLRDLTRRIVDEHRLALSTHTVAFIAPDNPVEIMGDELRLEQVLQNLLANAVKYSPDGGQITVALTSTGNLARIAVIDRGIGIPARELPRLFRRFYRAEHSEGRRIGGMGIGLYLVKEIVERHGGRIGVESVEGQGSTFTVELPIP
jgi:signal transduction histidine kinase